MSKFPLFFRLRIAAALVAIAAVLSGCMQGKPQILSTDIKLLRVQGPAGLFSERLSLFVLEKDADGPEDFGSLTLTKNDTGVSWIINHDSAMVTTKGQDRWIGSNALAESGDVPFVQGQYTVTLSDLAGNESVKTVDIVRPTFPDTAPVRFSSDGNSWVLERNPQAGDFTRVWLFLLDGQSRVLQSWKVPDTRDLRSEGSLESLQSMAMQAVSVQCYTENASGTAGVLLTPVDLR